MTKNRWEDAPLVDERSPTKSGNKWESAPLVEAAPKPQEPMPWYKAAAKALAYGVEQTAKGDSNTIGKLGGSVDLGVANAVHNAAGLDNYSPAGEVTWDSKRPIGERLASAPRAILESLPGLAQDVAAGAVGGLPGFAASHSLHTGGNTVDRVRAADGTSPDQGLSASQMGRVAASVAADTALSRIGAKATVGATAKGIIGAGLTDAASTAAAQAADKVIVDKKLPSLEDAAVGAIVGGGSGVAARGAHAAAGKVAEVPSVIDKARTDARFKDLTSSHDPKVLATVAAEIEKQAKSTKGLREENAGGVLDNARDALAGDAKTHAYGGKTGGPNIVEQQINAAAPNNPGLPFAYDRAVARLKAKEPVLPEHIKALESELGGQHPSIDAWLDHVKAQSALNQLGQMGTRQGDAIRGGIHGTDFAQRWKPFGKGYGGWADVVGPLGIGALGHNPALAAGLVAGHSAGWFGLRGLDKATGMSNPIGRFVDKFGNNATPLTSQQPSTFQPSPAQAARQQAAAQVAAARAQAAAQAARAANLQTLQVPNIGVNTNMPPSPWGASSPVSPSALAFNAKLLQRGKMTPEDLQRILPFKNDESTPVNAIPADDPLRLVLTEHRIRQSLAAKEKSETQAALDAEKAAMAEGIDVNSMPLPGLKVRPPKVKPREERPMPSQSTPEIAAAVSRSREAPAPMGEVLEATPTNRQKIDNFSLPKANVGEKPKASTKAAPEAAPMSQVLPKVHTRELGRFGTKVVVSEDKIRNKLDDGSPDVESYFSGTHNRFLEKENAFDALKAATPKRFHGKLDNLEREFKKQGMGRDLAQRAFDTFLDNANMGKATKDTLRELYKKSPLSKKKHWETSGKPID